MRLDKLLSNAGYGSRSEIKALLKKQVVTIDSIHITEGKFKVDPKKQIISINGEQINYKKYHYWMLHKPAGVISATEDKKDQTAIDLLAEEERYFSPFPVGRLDKDTEGLLLLTNDGRLAHQLLSPKKHVDKIYFAKISGHVTKKDVENFANGIKLADGYRTMPAKLVIKSTQADNVSEVIITIQEGKFHQIKRMFRAVGKQVTYLKRIQIGPLKLDESLPKGAYRELTEGEIKSLKHS